MIRSLQDTPAAPSAPEFSIAEDGRDLTLDRLAYGLPAACAYVLGIEGEPALRRRLMETGFTAGSAVRFVMATPFGDPLVFSLRGASIALRKSEARCVRVRF